MNFYEVLGVEPTASLAEIRQAHRAIIRASHPDLLGHRDEEASLRAANTAWATLSNPAARQHYDTTLALARTQGLQRGQPRLRVSEDQIINVVKRSRETQARRTQEMVRFGVVGVTACLVLLFFLSQVGG